MTGEGRGRVRRVGLDDSGIALGWWGRAILATLAALCQVLIFPPFGLAALTWVALTPLFLAVPARRPLGSIAVTWLFGTLSAFALIAPWLGPALGEFFGSSPFMTVLILLALAQLAGGVPLALLGLLLHLGARLSPSARALHAALSWVAIEYARVHVPESIPWALFGSALAPGSAPAQIADLGGAYAVSFLAALTSAAAAEVVRGAIVARGGRRAAPRLPPGAVDTQPSRLSISAVVLALAVVGAATTYGIARRSDIRRQMAAAPALRVAIVHADLPNARRQSPDAAPEALERYLTLSAEADHPDLVVWPENAVNLLLEDNPALLARIEARAGGTAYLVGAPRAVANATGAVLRTSALLVDADGIRGSYDKQRLLPFAETMPALRGAGAAIPRGFVPGAGTAVLTAADTRLGLLLCHEALFSELSRAAVRDGAELLVNLSNDSWFPSGAGPTQHFVFGRDRAIELRRTLVRAANRGVTAVVLPDGTIPVATDGRTPGVETVGVPRLALVTLYGAIGDVFAWLCIVGAIAFPLVGLAMTKKRVGNAARPRPVSFTTVDRE